MSNIDKLTNAGVIASGASLSSGDQNFINGLSDDEVSALISLHQNAPSGFFSRNCGPSSPNPGATQAIGIVF